MGCIGWRADRASFGRRLTVGTAALALLWVAPDFSALPLLAQCPNSQTKVTKPTDGTGYYFFRFPGEGSFLYFLEGKTFSFNEKDDPGKTFLFIDQMTYEPVLTDRPAMGDSGTSADAEG